MRSYYSFIFGAMFGGLSVLLGAIGAHAFKDVLLEHQHVDTWETATRFLFFHALALLFIGLWDKPHPERKSMPALFMVLGVVLFSGSLFLLSLTSVRAFAYITPFGGLSLVLSWAMILIQIWKRRKELS